MKISIRRFREGAILPTCADKGSAGLDLYACLEQPIVLDPYKPTVITTGLNIRIPEGYCMEILPRSGLAINHNVTVANSPGLIDSSYDGDGPSFEIKVGLINHGPYVFVIDNGMRIAQLVLRKVETMEWVEVFEDNLDRNQTRTGGLGSTGK